ncbi:MAG TPA: class I SAM-dependent methyltransferase [Candidatus Dormibacteraeota bacterium]|nr:class I SAM-dependent methyltransferase [Candidatus Dormibacteraeota bacterium]
MSLATMALALHFGRSALDGVAAFTLSEVVASIIWVVCAYSIAGFRLRGLALLGKDFALAALPIAGAGFGIHHFFSGWFACGLMAAVTAAAVGILWKTYGRKASSSASTINKFRRYWADKDGLLHRSEPQELYRAYVGEIRGLFPTDSPQRILEVGCGDGSDFSFLNVSPTAYRGVDFSPHFVDRFRSRYPDIDVQCAEGSSFVDSGAQYDVIFSNDVVQQFDPEMLDRHLQNARRMMHSGSVLILGSMPDGAHRRKFNAGWYSPTLDPRHVRCIRLLKATCRRVLGIDFSGYWYTTPEIAAIAKRRSFRACFVRSRLQPYRFHAVLFLDSACSQSPAAKPASSYARPMGAVDVHSPNRQST